MPFLRNATLAAVFCSLPCVAFAQEVPPPGFDVRGGDFPVLVSDTGLPPPLDEAGEAEPPGCEAVRARRVDELPWPWRDAVDRIHLDCQSMPAPGADTELLAIVSTAFLKPDRARLAGHPIAEVRLMDSELWGDHQYVIAAAYPEAARDLRTLVETDCLQRHLREEHAGAPACSMQAQGDGLYLQIDEVSGVWIHADPDDSQRTIYAEAWAD